MMHMVIVMMMVAVIMMVISVIIMILVMFYFLASNRDGNLENLGITFYTWSRTS